MLKNVGSPHPGITILGSSDLPGVQFGYTVSWESCIWGPEDGTNNFHKMTLFPGSTDGDGRKDALGNLIQSSDEEVKGLGMVDGITSLLLQLH